MVESAVGGGGATTTAVAVVVREDDGASPLNESAADGRDWYCRRDDGIRLLDP